MISKVAHVRGVGSLICIQGIPVPQNGYVETHAVLYPAFSILSKNFLRYKCSPLTEPGQRTA